MASCLKIDYGSQRDFIVEYPSAFVDLNVISRIKTCMRLCINGYPAWGAFLTEIFSSNRQLYMNCTLLSGNSKLSN